MHDHSKSDAQELSLSQARSLLNTGAQAPSFLTQHRETIEQVARTGASEVILDGMIFKLTYRGDEVRFNPAKGQLPCGWVTYRQ